MFGIQSRKERWNVDFSLGKIDRVDLGEAAKNQRSEQSIAFFSERCFKNGFYR